MPATGLSLIAVIPPKAPKAAPGRGAPPGKSAGTSVLIPGLYLVAALLVGALVIAIANRWRRGPRSETSAASEQLTEFRSLYEKGEMSREEFERVRAKLGVKIRSPEPVAVPEPKSAADVPPAPESPQTGITPAAPEPPPTGITPAAPPPADGRPLTEPPPNGIQPG